MKIAKAYPSYVLAAGVCLCAPPAFAQSANLALNRPVTVSSVETSTLTGPRAVDGNLTTRWASLEGVDPQWIYVDLGSSVALSRVVIRWEAAYARSYRIESSNNASTWTTLFTTSTGNGAVDDVAVSGSGRYVRVFGTQRGTQWGYSIFELEVYGPSGPACTTLPPAPTNLRSTGVTSTTVSLAWNASPPQPNCSVQYQVRQGTTQVAQTGNTSHTVAGLSPATTYSFTVVALNERGTSGPSNTATATTSTGGGGTPVAANGQLRVCGTKLCNQRGNAIQLRGMSTHGIQWYGRGTGGNNCLTDPALDALANDWKADVLRISMYIQEGGYETDPTRFTNEVHDLIEEVTQRGMYALVDWHMLDPGDPHVNLARARTFFTQIAQRHNNKNNIIYEIANEPNGVTWSRVKSYAEALIPTIRQNDPDAVILVGTRAWSSLGVSDGSNANEVINNPVNASNIMYTFHFYAASHGTSYRNELSRAADLIPMFVTEFGTQTASGDGGNNFTSAQAYIDLMRNKQISWVNWNFSHDFRSGAVFTSGTCPNGPFAGTSRLKPAGAWVRERILNPPDVFP